MISEKSHSRNGESNSKQLTLDEAIQSKSVSGDESTFEKGVFAKGMIRVAVSLIVIVGVALMAVMSVPIVDIIVSITIGAIMELLGVAKVIRRTE